MSRRDVEKLPTADVPDFADEEDLLGSMYVVEGSTLGGQLISRIIEDRLKLEDGNGYTFYRSYGPELGMMWREFGRFFNESVAPENIGGAVSGAQRTFEGIRQWLGATR